MLCAISGEAPQVPVASRKSGTVFERRLIEAYIQEHSRDPVTGEELSTEDLVDLKTQRTVKPRPPTFTSIPSLLSTFQNEWDALALESFTLKQHMSQLRQELSTALYNNDAAARVIARLTRERDEARDALSKLTLSDQKISTDAMQLDTQPLPPKLAATVESTQAQLMKTRRKRAVPEGWATPETISAMNVRQTSTSLVPSKSHTLSVNPSRTEVLVGGMDGNAMVYSLSGNISEHTVPVGTGAITGGILAERGDRHQMVIGTSNGEVLVLEQNGKRLATFKSHSGPVNGLALHPSNDIALSVGSDKSFVMYDLDDLEAVAHVYSDSELLCCEFHPDGHIFAAGGADGQIKIFDTITGANAANFDAGGALQALSFSENGIWLASAVRGTYTVSIWDLRKATRLEELDFGSQTNALRFDYTGQFLAAAGQDCVSIQHYDKTSKTWSEPLRKAAAASNVEWLSKASGLVVLTSSGELQVLE